MSSQLAAQLRILAGAGAATTTRAVGPASEGGLGALASSATLAGLAHAAPGSTASKYRASFLFAADVAAATDSATVHSMGASGMEQLVKLEGRLRPFLLSLCAAASFDRDAHSATQIAQVHRQLNQCIALLAPFFMLKPTHKVLEFLIRRYSVHVYNIPALMAAFLPYHESALFARLLQVLHIHLAVPSVVPGEPNSNKLFGFLEGAQRSNAASITRHTLVQRCMHDPAFLQWLVSLVALQSASSLSTTTITFYTTLMLELLSTLRASNNANHSDMKEAIARQIVQHALEVLNAHVNATASGNAATSANANAGAKTAAVAGPPRELVFSALLLLSQAALVHRFGTALDSALFLLLKTVPSARGDQTLAHPVCMALLALTQNQHVDSAPPNGVLALIASQGAEAGSPLVQSLSNLALQYDIAHLLRVLLPQIAAEHVGAERKHVQLLLCEMVSALPLAEAQLHALVATLLRSYVAAHAASESKEFNPKELAPLRKLVLLIQGRHSTQLESVVQQLIVEAGQSQNGAADGDEMVDGVEKKQSKKQSLKSSPMLALIHTLFEGSAHEVLVGVQGASGTGSGSSSGSILTCLQSPLAHVRIKALQAIDALDISTLVGPSGGDATLAAHLQSALVSKLSDADAGVVRATLRLKSLVRLVPFEELVHALAGVFARFGATVDGVALARNSASKLLEAALKLVAKLVATVVDDEHSTAEVQGAQLHTLLDSVFPFLFELALVRPAAGVTPKLARAAQALMVLLASKAKRAPHHHRQVGAEDEESNGFLLCALFAHVAALPATAGSEEDLTDSASIRSHNQSMLAAWAGDMAAAAATASGSAVEGQVVDALERAAAAVAAASRASTKVGTVVRASAPSTAFAMLQLLNQTVASLAANKKADAALFLRLARVQHKALSDVWSSFTAEQRRNACAAAPASSQASASSALVSPVSFITSASGGAMTPASFPAFVRSSLAFLVGVVGEFVSTHSSHASATEGATSFLRELYGFFVADAESVTAFGAHIALLCKQHLHGGGLQETVGFLLPLLQGSGAGSAASLQVSVRSFHLLHALLSNQAAVGSGKKAGKAASKEDASLLADLGATFLLAFASPARAVRHAAVMAVPALVAALSSASSGADKKSASSGALVSQLLSGVYSEKEELLSASSGDASRDDDTLRESATDSSLQYMQGFVAKMIGANASAGSVFKSDAQRAELHRFLAAVALRFASSSASASVSSGCRLLQLLRRLPHDRVADLTLPHLSSLLSTLVRSDEHISVAVELLEQIDASVLRADTKAAFSCLMDAFSLTAASASDDDSAAAASGSSRRAVTAIQAAALARFSVESFELLSEAQQEQLFDTLLRINASTGNAAVGALVAVLPFDSAVFAKRLVLTGAATSEKVAKKGKKAAAAAAAAATGAPASELAGVQAVLELLQLKDPSISLRSPFALVAPLFNLLDLLSAHSKQAAAAGADAPALQAVEYAKQLTMASLSRFLAAPAAAEAETAGKKSKKASASGFNVKDINVDAVVACLNASGEETRPAADADAGADASTPASQSSPAATALGSLHTLNVSLENTRSHALTLLSLIGQSYPELIVGVLIPIFQALLLSSTNEQARAATSPANAVSSAMEVDGETSAATGASDVATGAGADSADVDANEPYALRLLNQLISSVLPSIVRAKLQWNVWQLLSVFVDSLGSAAQQAPKSKSAALTLKKKGSAVAAATAGIVNRRRLRLFHNLLTSLQSQDEDAPVGAGDSHLHEMVALLLAKSVTEKSAAAKQASGASASAASAAALVQFAHVLCEQFGAEPVVQIRAFNNLLQLLSSDIESEHGALLAAQSKTAVLKLSGSGSRSKSSKKSSADSGVSELKSLLRTSAQRSSWQKGVLSFLSQHLARLSFAQQIYLHAQRTQQDDETESEEGSDSGIQGSFLHLFELLFARLRSSLQLNKHLATDETHQGQVLAAHFLLLSTHTKQALLHLNGLLTMPNFVRILQELFRISDSGSQRDLSLILQALSLLHSKLISYKDAAKVHSFASGKGRKIEDDDEAEDGNHNDDMSDPNSAERVAYFRKRKAEQRLLVSLLPALQQLLDVDSGDDASSQVKSDEAAMKQSALLNLDMLASSFGHMRQFQAEFVKLVPIILRLTLLPKPASPDDAQGVAELQSLLHSHAWQHISTSALLCMATLVSSFQTKAHVLLLEFVPTLVPNTIAILQHINAPVAATTTAATKAASKKRKHNDEESEEEAEDSPVASNLHTLDSLAAPLLQLSALSVLQACIVSVADLLSPYLADLLKVLLFPGYHNSAAGPSSIALIAAAGAVNATTVATAANAAVSAATAATGASASSSVDHSSVSTVVSQSLSALISKLPSRTLLPYLFNHYKTAAAQGYSSLRRLFQLLALVIAQLQADGVKQHFKLIFKFFLAAAQQLRKAPGVSGSAADSYGVTLGDAEDALIGAFLELTMKLNETSFKGLFLKMLQWVGPIPHSAEAEAAAANGDPAGAGAAHPTHEFLNRSLVFFKLIHQLTGKLKGIFVTYFGYILDHCVLFLNAPKDGAKGKKAKGDDMEDEESEQEEEDDEERASKKIKAADGSASASASAKTARNAAVLGAGVSGGVPSELIDLVLLSLRNCFLYDTQHFMDKYHFTLLTSPMVQQLQYAFDTRVDQARGAKHKHQPFDEFISATLTPTVVQMAIRMGNYLQWKPLVSALMLHGRSPSGGVRRASVYVFEQLFVSIGDNLLVILPELLPWISELLEDADVGVERNVHRLVKIIEKLSGESLDATLNG